MKNGERVAITVTIQGNTVIANLTGRIESIKGSKVTISLGVAGTWMVEKSDLLPDGPGAWKMTVQVKT